MIKRFLDWLKSLFSHDSAQATSPPSPTVAAPAQATPAPSPVPYQLAPSTLAYYDPNRVVGATTGPATPEGPAGVLNPKYRFPAGGGTYKLVNVLDGTRLEIAVSDGNGSINVSLVSPTGKDLGMFTALNAGTKYYMANETGDYTVVVTADSAGVVTHWRS